MYHLTDVAAVESIKRSGLTPRGSVSRGYPPRVYLFTNVVDLNEQIENNIEAWEPGLSWNDQLTKSPDMVVIEIDPGALRKGTKFEVDPEYSGSTGAVYTKSHIPPEAIVKITPVSGKYVGVNLDDQNVTKTREK
jgi:ribosomal protein L21E